MASLKLEMTKVKKSDKETISDLTRHYLATLNNNNKSLSETEESFERKAEKLPILRFPRIHPHKATIGFMIRNMEGGNVQAIEYIRMSLPANAANSGFAAGGSAIYQLVKEFDHLDINSQMRVDCLDWLCRRSNITPSRFLKVINDGILAFHDEMTKTIIAEKKPELADKILRDAISEDKKSTGNKRLAAEMSGVISNKPLVEIDQSQTRIVNDNRTQVLSFSEYTKRNDKEVRGEKLLEDGNTINAEFEGIKEND